MEQIYDTHAVAVLISEAIAERPRGTQAKLARHVGVPEATVSRWAKRQSCPAHTYWPALEEFFEMEPGTIRGAGGVGQSQLGETESSILGDDRLTEDQRRVMLAILNGYVEDNRLRVALEVELRSRSRRRTPTGPS